MYALRILLSSILLLSSTGVSAQSTSTWTKIVTFCKTTYGPNSPSTVPTRTSTTRENTAIRLTWSVTPVRTVTPRAVTTTRTTRGTLGATEVIYSTVTSPVTSTYSTTITEILIKPTTTTTITVPTLLTDVFYSSLTMTLNGAPTVTPVTDTLPGATGGTPRNKKRTSRAERGQNPQHPPRYPSLEVRQDPAPSYVRRVDCIVVSKEARIVIVERNAPATTFTTSGRTVTQRVDNAPLITQTYYEPFSSVVSVVTETATYTSTRIPMTTVTDYTYYSVQSTTLYTVQSVYPQCLNPNGAYTISGTKVQSLEPASPTALNQIVEVGSFPRTGDGQTCCGYCLEDPTCAASFVYGQPGGYGCNLISRANGVCDAANPLLLRALYENDSDPANHPTAKGIFNNKCGKFVESRQGSF